MVQIEGFDINSAVTSLNCVSAAPWEGHLKWLVKIFGCLQDATGRRKSIVIYPEDTRETSGNGDNTVYWLESIPM